VLTKAVAGHPLLEVLSLCNNITIGYRGLALIGRELRKVQLRELNIDSCVPDDNPGISASKMFYACCALADGLKCNNSIQRINWNNNEFGAEEVRMLMRATANRRVLLNATFDVRSDDDVVAIGEELPSAQFGEVVLMSNATYTVEDPFYGALGALAHGLSNSRTLYAVTVSLEYYMPSDEAIQLMQAVRNHPTIQCLRLLNSGMMSMDGLQAIGEQLPNAKTLKSLFLNGFSEDELDEETINSFTADDIPYEVSVINSACLALANGVRSSRSLQELNLYNRHLQFPHALELVRAAAGHPSLQKLSFNLKLSISLVEAEQLAAVLPTLQLKEFLTDFRGVWEAEETAHLRRARDALLEVVKSNFSLHKLTIPAFGLENTISFYLELNRLGRLGLIQEQGISPARWCDVLATLNVAQTFYFFSNQPLLLSMLLASCENDE
jgi:hypothetical protein